MKLADLATGSDWIVWIVFVIFAALSITLLSGHGSWFISGYNTATKEEKEILRSLKGKLLHKKAFVKIWNKKVTPTEKGFDCHSEFFSVSFSITSAASSFNFVFSKLIFDVSFSTSEISFIY